MPPQLIGIIPTNNGGFGSVGEAKDTFFELEVQPIMQDMLEMNNWFGLEVLRFSPYTTSDGQWLIYPDGEKVPADRPRRR